MKRFFVRFILPLIVIAAAVMCLMLGVKTMQRHKTFPKTDAVIAEIQKEYDSARKENDYHVFVTYTVDGQEYTEELGQYVAGYKVGKELEISYNPENPADIQAGGAGSGLIMIGLGVVAALAGIVSFVKSLLGRR